MFTRPPEPCCYREIYHVINCSKRLRITGFHALSPKWVNSYLTWFPNSNVYHNRPTGLRPLTYNQLQEPRRWAPVNYFCHSSLPSALFGYEKKKITMNCSPLPPRQITKPNALETPSTHMHPQWHYENSPDKTWWELSWHSHEVIAIISTKREYTWISASRCYKLNLLAETCVQRPCETCFSRRCTV